MVSIKEGNYSQQGENTRIHNSKSAKKVKDVGKLNSLSYVSFGPYRI